MRRYPAATLKLLIATAHENVTPVGTGSADITPSRHINAWPPISPALPDDHAPIIDRKRVSEGFSTGKIAQRHQMPVALQNGFTSIRRLTRSDYLTSVVDRVSNAPLDSPGQVADVSELSVGPDKSSHGIQARLVEPIADTHNLTPLVDAESFRRPEDLIAGNFKEPAVAPQERNLEPLW
jgi:hypothetical protein